MSGPKVSSTIAVKINPLREFHYTTWDDLSEALGFAGAKLLFNHRREPSKRSKPSAVLKASVDALFEQKFPFPLPHYQQLIRQRLTAAKRTPGEKCLLDVVQEIEGIVADAAPANAIHAAGLNYLHYLALHARAVLNNKNAAFGDKTIWRAALAGSIAALDQGRAIIAVALKDANHVPDEAVLKELDTWLFLNWVVAVGSYVPGDSPPDPAEFATTLRQCHALARFRSALQDLPHEWRVPYNGLDVASRLRASDEELQLFFSRLCDFDVGFSDFDYTPGEVPTIAANPGLEFFRDRCRVNPNITTPTRKA